MSRQTGFALLSPERRKEMASLGGKASSVKGVSHKWTTEEAREAGRKGGVVNALRVAQRAVSK